MKKSVTYRQVNHHLCNLTFILSSIILLVVFLSQIIHITLAHMFSYLVFVNIGFIIASITSFLISYGFHKTYKKLEKISAFMVASAIVVLLVAFVIETTLFH
jgi:uncharacterized membrane protein